MKTTLREHVEQLIKEYQSYISLYQREIQKGLASKNYSEVANCNARKHELTLVVKDLEESLK